MLKVLRATPPQVLVGATCLLEHQHPLGYKQNISADGFNAVLNQRFCSSLLLIVLNQFELFHGVSPSAFGVVLSSLVGIALFVG
jgi:hypothetical protein